MYLIVWSFAIASVLGALFCFFATPGLAKITKVPFAVLGPGLVVIMLLGAFQESGQLGDLWIMIALGLFGWLLKETGFPRAPFLIGFVLALPLERYYFLTDAVYDGAEWMLRPWVLVFIAVLVVPGILSLVKKLRARTNVGTDDEHAEPPPEDEHEGELAGSVWSLAAAAGMLAIFVAGFIVATSFSAEARLVPRLICAAGAILTIVILVTEVAGWRKSGSSGVRWTPDVGVAMRTFVWMLAFLGLVALMGYLGALLIFVPAFLLFVSRARPRTVVIYALVLAVVLAVLPSLVPIDLPTGLLTTL
jgi:hypothetical protein